MFKAQTDTLYGTQGPNWKSSFLAVFSRADIKAWLLIFFSVAVIAIGIWSLIMIKTTSLDPDNCLIGALPNHAATILVDLTDEVWPTGEQLRKVNTRVEHYRDNLAIGDRFSIYTLVSDQSEQPSELRLLFSACRPQSSDTVNSAYQSVLKVKKRYENNWLSPINVAIKSIDDNVGRGSKTSPLMTSLKEIALTPSLQAQTTRSIEVFSDLLEHGQVISHYNSRWPTFNELKRDRWDAAQVDGIFTQVNVRVWQFNEALETDTNYHQTPQHGKFWVDWMQTTKANFELSRL